MHLVYANTGWPKKSKPLQNNKKSYYIDKIRFFRQIKVSIKHYNITRW